MTECPEWLTKHMQRMQEIREEALTMTTLMGIMQTRLIFMSTQGRVPKGAELPEGAIDEFISTLREGVNGSVKPDSGSS